MIDNGSTIISDDQRCQAESVTTGERCRNPAVTGDDGSRYCMTHHPRQIARRSANRVAASRYKYKAAEVEVSRKDWRPMLEARAGLDEYLTDSQLLLLESCGGLSIIIRVIEERIAARGEW